MLILVVTVFITPMCFANCMQSIDVDPTKTITYKGQSYQCEALEIVREQHFSSEDAVKLSYLYEQAKEKLNELDVIFGNYTEADRNNKNNVARHKANGLKALVKCMTKPNSCVTNAYKLFDAASNQVASQKAGFNVLWSIRNDYLEVKKNFKAINREKLMLRDKVGPHALALCNAIKAQCLP